MPVIIVRETGSRLAWAFSWREYEMCMCVGSSRIWAHARVRLYKYAKGRAYFKERRPTTTTPAPNRRLWGWRCFVL